MRVAASLMTAAMDGACPDATGTRNGPCHQSLIGHAACSPTAPEDAGSLSCYRENCPVLVAGAADAMRSSAYHPGDGGWPRPILGVTWGRVIRLGAGGSIPHPTGEPEGTSASSAAAQQSEYLLVRHWMPWLIPLLAIAFPMLYFIVAGSIPDAAWRWGEAPTSLGRGDFLIPVLILCLEAIRRWWSEVTCGWKMGIVRLFSTALCAGAVIVCSDSFSVAASHPVTAHSTKSVIVITWACFAVGLFAGTIAVWASVPEAGKS